MTVAVLAALAASLAPGATPRLVEGEPSSRVRVLIYEDLQCPDCAAFRQMLDEKLLPKYGARVAFEHRDFPLAKHAWARRAAIAARFFLDVSPELAVKFRRHCLESIQKTTVSNFSARLAAFAEANGVDPGRAAAALDDAAYAAKVEADVQDGVARGVAKTPTALVNGEPFVEAIPFEEIARAIDRALASQP
jgi:protein-disulfide isomerase